MKPQNVFTMPSRVEMFEDLKSTSNELAEVMRLNNYLSLVDKKRKIMITIVSGLAVVELGVIVYLLFLIDRFIGVI